MSHAALENEAVQGSATRQVACPPCLQGEMSSAVAGADPCRPTGILVIEDERLLLKSLDQGLRKRGFAVWAAADGGEGVDLYRRFWPQIDVVLSDVRMPVMDGPTTLDALREIDPLVRFCFMTGDTRRSTLTTLLKLGALRVFTKPFPSVAEVAEELRDLAARPPVAAPVEDAREETGLAPADRGSAGGFYGCVVSLFTRLG